MPRAPLSLRLQADLYYYLAFLFLIVHFEFEQQPGELSNIDEPIISTAAVDEELDLFLTHPVSLQFLSRLRYVQFTTPVLVQRLELLYHVFCTSSQTKQHITVTECHGPSRRIMGLQAGPVPEEKSWGGAKAGLARKPICTLSCRNNQRALETVGLGRAPTSVEVALID